MASCDRRGCPLHPSPGARPRILDATNPPSPSARPSPPNDQRPLRRRPLRRVICFMLASSISRHLLCRPQRARVSRQLVRIMSSPNLPSTALAPRSSDSLAGFLAVAATVSNTPYIAWF